MNTIHHRGVNSYLDQEYKTKAIPKNIILSKSKHDSYFDVILHRIFQLRDSVCHNCLRNLHIPMRNDRNTSANSPMSGATRPYNRAPKVPVSEIVGNRHHFCIPENQSTWKIVKKPKKLLLFLTYASSCTPFLKYLYPVSHWQISKWYITCLF